MNADFVKVARSFGSSDWQMFLTVALPSSVPLLLTGLRLGLGHALVGIVVGEMYGATHGLGFLIATAGARFQTDKVMVGIILIAAAGVAMTELLRMIERRFERWRPSVGDDSVQQATPLRRHPEVRARPLRPGAPRRATA